MAKQLVSIFVWIYKNSKKILLYSQLGWHLGSQQNLRKKVYTNWIKKKKYYHVIDVNFEEAVPYYQTFFLS